MQENSFEENVQVIWHDADLLVINKPAGLLSLPDGYDQSLPHVKGVLTLEFGSLWIVHRLDRQTSGVMVLARSARAHQHLNNQFQERRAGKTYHAVVSGRPTWDQKRLDLPLRIDGDRQHRTVVDQTHGIPAITNLKVLERFKNCCLVEARPVTGRRHQIRAHLANLGTPVLVDVLYGKSATAQFNMPRLALHAWSLEISPPGSSQQQKFQAPYPADFASLLEQLRVQRQ